MKALRTLTSAAVLAASMAAFPASATAQVEYTYNVAGTEVYATSTKGRFVGTAIGSATGTWYAEVVHDPLGPGLEPEPIHSGSFGMVLIKAEPAHTVSGKFSGGSITLDHSGANCTNQVYTVNGDLTGVSVTGEGSVSVTLTHHRKKVLGKCWLYAATVGGTVELS
jgi:hypothetical protein